MIKLNQVAPCLSCFCWRLVGSICTAVDVGLIIDIQFDRSSFGAVSEQFQSSFRAVVNLFLRSPRVWNVWNCNCILRVPMAISVQFQCSFRASASFEFFTIRMSKRIFSWFATCVFHWQFQCNSSTVSVQFQCSFWASASFEFFTIRMSKRIFSWFAIGVFHWAFRSSYRASLIQGRILMLFQ